MNNDGEDLREFLCDLCRCHPAVQGEMLCRECIAAHETEEIDEAEEIEA